MSRRSTLVSPYLAEVRKLAETLAVMQQKVAALDTVSQADFTSIEDGSMDVYDEDGTLRGRFGKQPDGSYTMKAFGKKPQTPTNPDVIPVSGGCVVEWDGTFEEAQENDIQRIAIHVGSTAGFAIITGEDDDENSDEDSTEKAAILSPRGGSAFLALDPEETYYVRLTAIAEGGAESDPTGSVEVYVAAPEAKFWQDSFTLSSAGAQDITLSRVPLHNSEHLYWNGLYQREDVSWTGIGRVVSLLAAGTNPAAGDVVTVEYAYLDEEEGEIPLAFGSTGWRYSLIAFADNGSRSPTGYSDPRAEVEYDDSGWDVGDMGFGSTEPDNDGISHPYLDWTFWPIDSAIWVRRRVIVDPGGVDLTVTVEFDNYCRVFWNGVQVYYGEVSANAQRTFTIPAADVLQGENRIAIRASDELANMGFDGAHLDIQIVYA